MKPIKLIAILSLFATIAFSGCSTCEAKSQKTNLYTEQGIATQFENIVTVQTENNFTIAEYSFGSGFAEMQIISFEVFTKPGQKILKGISKRDNRKAITNKGNFLKPPDLNCRTENCL